MRVLHHARRPELVVSELARVTRPGGRILLVDQLGFVDPVVSAETDRFEQARDPSHTRLLPDQDIRFLLDANDLEVLTNEIAREERDLERYLDLVGLEGDERRRVQRDGARRGLRGRDRLVRRAQARRADVGRGVWSMEAPDSRADLVVVGAGIVGLAVARRLHRKRSRARESA